MKNYFTTCKDLIEQLIKLPPDAPVFFKEVRDAYVWYTPLGNPKAG